ncbi:hypothetical protein A6302_03290 [Methylobrevis pamukkalensis]|uniref:Uncharacterized protein n=1 Tax=Methylobrevis pamukkalensis TaxID=1439726 RepID=A0A1E3GZC5_9HYPH|nr:hypothetical protein A6302_03290 [Methylobrevis pamukkalensis]
MNPILDKAERKVFRRFLQEHFSNRTHPRASVMPKYIRQQIRETYADDNRTLFARFIRGYDQELDQYLP